MVEQWNMWWWNSGTPDGATVEPLMVEQYDILWWNSGPSAGGTAEHRMVEQWNRDGRTVEHLKVEQ